MKIKILLFLLAVFTTGQCFASDFNDGTLNYTILSGTKNVQVDGLINRSSTTAITIPATVSNGGNTYNVTSIYGYAFYYCTGLTSIDLSKATNLQAIGGNAFDNCTAAEFITTTGSPATAVKYNALTSIGDNAFRSCTGLKSFDISGAKNLTSIGKQAFYGCTGLTSFDISEATNLTSIENYVFNGCTGLTTFTIPASVTSIRERAFNNSGLASIDLSQATNLKTIETFAFGFCGNLTSVTIPASVTSLGDGAFGACTRLTSVTIPALVTSLGGYAFNNCTGLKSVDLSQATKLQTIGEGAFGGCSKLTSIAIPASVTSIIENAFYYCPNLTSVYMESTVPPSYLGANIFAGCNSNLKFYINDGTTDKSHISAYINAQSTTFTNSNTVPYLPKTVTAAKVATLYLPYEVAIPAGVTAYYCSGKETGKLMLKSLTETIPANTPVVIRSDAGTFNFLGNGGTDAQPSDIDAALQGTFTDITNNSTTQSDYLALGEKTGSAPAEYGFYRFTGTTIDANTCYVAYSNDAKGLDLSFDGSVTGIKDITGASSDDANAPKVIYDLQGRRVNNPQHGIYIMNGKKVIIK